MNRDVTKELNEKVLERKLNMLNEHDIDLLELTNNLPMSIFRFEVDEYGAFKVTYLNNRIETILGVSSTPEEYFTSFIDSVYKDDRHHVLETIQTAIAQKQDWFCEARLVNHLNQQIWFRGIGKLQIIEDKYIYDGITIDISEQKISENIIKELSENFDDFNGINIFDKISNFLIKLFDFELAFIGEIVSNQSILNILGSSHRESIISEKQISIFESFLKNLPKQLKSEYLDDLSNRFPNDSFIVKYNFSSLFVFPIFSKSEQLIGCVVLAHSNTINDFHLLDKQLQILTSKIRNEIQLAFLEKQVIETQLSDKTTKSISELITWTYDANNELFSLSGLLDGASFEYHLENGVSFNDWMDLIHPDDKSNLKVAFWAYITGQSDNFETEFRQLSPNNNWIWLYSKGQKIIRNKDNNIQKVFGYVMNITNQKNNIFELTRRSVDANNYRNKMKLIVEQSPMVIIEWDLQLRVKTWNKAAENLFGYTYEEAFGKFGTELILEPNLYDVIVAYMQELATNPNTPRHNINKNLKKNKDIITCEWFNDTLCDEFGNVIGLISFATDITDRMLDEERLRESENKFAIIYQSIPDAVILSRKEDGVIFEVNNAFERICGYSRAEAIGNTLESLDIFYKGQRKEILSELLSNIDTPIETEIQHKNKSKLYGIVSINVIKISNVECLIARFRDITHIKNTNEELNQRNLELRAYRERMQLIVEQTPLAIIEWDMDFRVKTWNKYAEKIFGYTFEEAYKQKARDLILTNTLLEEITGYWQQIVEDNADHLQNININRTKDNSIITCEWFNETLKDENGKIVGVISVANDITLRIENERKIKESESKFALLYETNPDAIILRRRSDFIILEVNSAFTSLSGFSKEEVIGKTAREINLWGENHTHTTLQILLENKGQSIEIELRHKNGATVYAIASADIIEINGEEFIISRIRDITEKLRSEILVQEKELKFKTLMESLLDGYVLVDLTGKILECNQAYADITGYSINELFTKTYQDLTPEKWHEVDLHFINTQAFVKGYSEIYEKEYLHKDGHIVPIELRVYSVKDNNGEYTSIWGIVRDISERKKSEKEKDTLISQINNIQKLESIGRLAGGVAHDFNNMLTPIMGYAELLKIDVQNDDNKLRKVNHIINSVKRSKDLVAQLLTFARKQTIELNPIEVNKVINDFLPMLKRILRADISFDFISVAKNSTIMGDASQLEQIIMNLFVNSQDAMPNSGKLIVQTEEVYVDSTFLMINETLKEGQYLKLSVSDTGIGMSKEVQSKIFEPFFTTKELGKGTGLGLPTLYGIVNQMNGYVWLYSEEGVGTTFNIYLPLIENHVSIVQNENESGLNNVGKEMILIVEDEEIVRDMAKEILMSYEYKVTAVANSQSALNLANELNDFDLLITDVILPDINGKDLYNEIKKINPNIKVIFMSGYTANVISNDDIINEDLNFIQKPFSLKVFLQKVRETLEK